MYKTTNFNSITKEILKNCSNINVNLLLNNFDKIININNFDIKYKWQKNFLIPFLNEFKEPFEKYKQADVLTGETKEKLLKYKEILLVDLIKVSENNSFSFKGKSDLSKDNISLLKECCDDFNSKEYFAELDPYSMLKTLLSDDSLKEIPFLLSENLNYIEKQNRFTNVQNLLIYNQNFKKPIEEIVNLQTLPFINDFMSETNKMTVYHYLLSFCLNKCFIENNKTLYARTYFNENYDFTFSIITEIENSISKFLIKEDLSIQDYKEFKKIESLNNVENHIIKTFLNWFFEEYIQPNKTFEKNQSMSHLSTVLYKQPESLKDFYENHLTYNETFLKNLYSTEKAFLFNRMKRKRDSTNIVNEFTYFIREWHVNFLEPFFMMFYKSLNDLIKISCLTKQKKRNQFDSHQNNKIFCKENLNILNVNKSLINTFQLFPFNYQNNKYFFEEKQLPIKGMKRNFIKSKIFNKMNLYTLKEYKTHFTLNEKKIFSSYSKEIVDLFKTKAIHLDENLFKNFNKDKIFHRIEYETLDEKLKNKSITLNSNTSELIDSNTFDNEMKNFLKNTFESSLNTKIKVIYVPGFNNKSKKETLRIQNTTFKTILKKDGFMIPVFIPFIHLDKNELETLSWNFTFITYLDTKNNFLNFINEKESNSYRLDEFTINQFNLIFESLYSYDHKMLLDLESYLVLKNKKFKNFSVYSKNIIKYIKENNIKRPNLKKIIQEMNQIANLKNDKNLSYVKLFDKIKIDKKEEKKLNKIKQNLKSSLKHKVENKDKIDFFLEEIKDQKGLEKLLLDKLNKRKIDLEKLELELLKAKKKQIVYDSVHEEIKTMLNLQNVICQKDYQKNIKKNNVINNNFLNNTLENNINVTSLKYYNVDDENVKLFVYNLKNLETLKENSMFEDIVLDLEFEIENSMSYTFDEISLMQTKININEYTLKEVQFNTLQPNLIKIDSSEKYVVGGPYRVKVTQNDLYIALQNSNSVFGKSQRKIKVHPHAGELQPIYSIDSFAKTFLKYQRACLGEACSLLYSAFKNNDINQILIGSMIWIKSANSSDFWGKTYKWFPKPEEVNYDFIELKNIPTLSEIQSFLNEEQNNEQIEIIEEEEEIFLPINNEEVNDIEPQQNEEVNNIEPQQNEENRSIENFNTNEGYNRYTS